MGRKEKVEKIYINSCFNLSSKPRVSGSQIGAKLVSSAARIARAEMRRKTGPPRGTARSEGTRLVGRTPQQAPFYHSEVSETCPSLPSASYCVADFLEN